MKKAALAADLLQYVSVFPLITDAFNASVERINKNILRHNKRYNRQQKSPVKFETASVNIEIPFGKKK